MKHSLIFWLFLSFPIVSLAQDARDEIIGTYAVQKQQDGNGVIFLDTLLVSKNSYYSDQIIIATKNDGGTGTSHIFDPIDSSFVQTFYPALQFGQFFPNDSVFFLRHAFNTMPPFFAEYKGFKIQTGVSISEQNAKDDWLHVITDPVTSTLHINYNGLRGLTTLELYAISGKKVWSEKVVSAGGEASISLDVSGHPSGIYLLHLVNSNRKLTRKILFP
ncbi:MAG: T9SS type A sorting domain-containing protein [Flavobacteriales bacterium]